MTLPLPDLTLVTSNPRKAEEFRRYGLNLAVAAGRDLPEVQGTITQVIVHKAIAAGAGRVVEDTVLRVDGRPIVDIRWCIDRLGAHAAAPCEWVVSLGVNDGTRIRIHRGVVRGTLAKPSTVPADAFGFDPYLIPEGADVSLYELERQGRKDEFSARRAAALSLISGRAAYTRIIAKVPPWAGAYQHD